MQNSFQRKLPRVKLITIAILAAYFTPVLAENKAEVLETQTIEVVGTTPLPSIGTPINQVPSNVQTGTTKDIEQQQSLNLGEFLDSNLGSVNTSNSVGNPYQMDVSYRGFTASPILGSPVGMSVYLDGVRINEPFGDIVNWDLIPTYAISNINLIPGSNPLFGLNTLGGALSVHTKSGTEFPGISATASGGSWGRRAFEFEAGGADKDKNVDYFLAGNFFKEDGWRDHSSSEVNQIFGKVGWQNDTSDLDLSVALADNTMEGTQSLPLSMLNNPKQAYTWPDSIENKLAMITLKGSHFVTDDKLIAGNIYYRKSDANSFNSNAQLLDPTDLTSIDASNVTSKTNQDGYGGSLQFSLLGDLAGHKNQFTVGASADFSRVSYNQDSLQATLVGTQTITDPSNTSQGSVRLKTRSDYYGVYATDNFSFNDQWNMTLSGRYNIAKVDLSGGSDPDGTGFVAGSLDGNHEFKRFNPAIGFNYNPSKNLGFYAGYDEGMRAPTPVELSCADPAVPCSLPTGFNSDPNLAMVVAKTWEGGVRGKLSQDVSWNAGVYNTVTSNDIQFIATNTSQGFFQNVGETQRRGLELGLNGKFDKLTLGINYGFVDATYQSDFTVGSASNSVAIANGSSNIDVVKGNRIPGIARQTLKLRAAYDITPTWNIGSNMIVASGQYAHGDENNQDINGKVPGYAVVNLDTHYSINENWRVFAKLNNVFDKDYATFGQLGNNIYTGIDEQFRTPSAPRAAWIGVTFDFGRPKNSAAAVDKD
jgi:iron complex outermembrane recepter protein